MADLATTVQRWQQGAGTGQQRYIEGVQGTQKDVVALAVSAQPKLLTNFNQAVNSGFWARRLQARGTAGWKTQTIAKASNWSTGIAAGLQDYQTAMQTWLPIIQAAAASVQGMPNATFQDSLNRMTAYATALHNAKLAR